MWVLIAVSTVYYGQIVTFQEFTTKQRCEAAVNYIITVGRKDVLKSYTCMEK